MVKMVLICGKIYIYINVLGCLGLKEIGVYCLEKLLLGMRSQLRRWVGDNNVAISIKG